MKRPTPRSFTARFIVILALTTPVLPCAALSVPKDAADLLAYEEFLKHLESDQVRSAAVDTVSISRAGAVFDLRGGEIHLVSDPSGREVAALYEGSGHFRLDLTSRIEYEQLRRLTQLDSAFFEFQRLYIVFSDNTGAELSQHLKFEPRDPNDKIKDRWSKLYKLLTNEGSKSLPSPLLQGLANGETRKLFYTGFDGPGGPWYFEINPFDREEVKLRRAQNVGSYDYRELICSFPRPTGSSTESVVEAEYPHGVKITDYRISANIDGGLDFDARAEIDVVSHGISGPWLYFTLYPDLEVTSVAAADGTPLPFVRDKNQWRLLVSVGEKLQPNDEVKLTIEYHGDIIDKEVDWTFINAPTDWYPSSRYLDTAVYDLTFTCPKGYRFASVGELLAVDTVNKAITTHWRSTKALDQASFNIGLFDEHTVQVDGVPAVSVQWSESMHDRLRRALASEAITLGKDMEKRIGADVANSLAFYQNVFGPCPSESLVVTEIPFDHGQAFLGLLHLSTSTYNSTDDDGWDEVFRAHEVAHQWWGFGVGTDSYHDRWISEGFSTFSALWFVQAVYGKNNSYFDFLKRWRQRLYERSPSQGDLNQQCGPIWMGTRNSSKDRENDYSLVVYRKGAWVLHMLRNMMLNFETMKDDIFVDMMRDFYQRFQGKEVSTADFQAHVEDHAGMEMGWFFDQWVYGTAMPTYYFAYEIEETPDAEYITHCRVRQADVPPDFKMFAPISVSMDKNEPPLYFQVFITGAESRFDLPALPRKPKEVVLNGLESVLAEVKTEKW